MSASPPDATATVGQPGADPRPGADLRVVVVCYHPGPELDTLLASLPAALGPAAAGLSWEVVLADNGGTAGRPGTRVLPTGGNLGYGRAANAGAAGHRGRWLLVVNPDVRWQPGALAALVAAADRWPAAGAFGPAILTPDGDLYPSARALPSLGRGLGHAVLGWLWPDNPATRSYRREGAAPQEGPTGWLSGACLLLRTAAFQAVGGFDPAYFMYFEDTDLGARLAAAGYPSVYVPGAHVVHTGGVATGRHRSRMLYAHHRSALRYLSRRYPLLTPLLAVGLAARFLATVAIRRLGEGARPTRSGRTLRS